MDAAKRANIVRRALRTPSAIQGAFCAFPHRTCLRNRAEGSEFCLRHVLEDKNTTYKQCNYNSQVTGRRCHNPALKNDKKDGFCLMHARRSLRLRQRAGRVVRPRENPELLLEGLERHSGVPDTNPTSGTNHIRSRTPPAEYDIAKLLEYASSGESDAEAASCLVEQAWEGDVNSDAESIDSEQEDPLKHAGVYTAEEVAQITRDKLIRLQSLYIEQFKRLQHVMKEKRRKYIRNVRREKEALGSVHAAKERPEQREEYEQLCALKRYHRRFGKEALLHRQSKERRISVTEGPNYRVPPYPKCILQVRGVRCAAKSLPLSKYCLQHILHDPHQTLYEACAYAEGMCPRPVAAPTMSKEAVCTYHVGLNDYKKHWPNDNLDESSLSNEVDVVSCDVSADEMSEAGYSMTSDPSRLTTPEPTNLVTSPETSVESNVLKASSQSTRNSDINQQTPEINTEPDQDCEIIMGDVSETAFSSSTSPS